MSEIIRDLQQQSVDSELLNLYDLEIEDGVFIYLHPGEEEVVFDGHTYIPVPIEAEGYEINSDGAYSRPTLTVANLESIFSEQIMGVGFKLEDLTGKYITRRRTLKKYLGTSVEFPSTKYIIDRIQSKNIISVVFELAIPFDIAGISFPRRVIIGTSCPWVYQGDYEGKDSGCLWYPEYAGGNPIYVNKFDEYLVLGLDSNGVFNPTSPFSGSATSGQYVHTIVSRTRINSDGLTSLVSVKKYWQCLLDTTEAPSESLTSVWRVVHPLHYYSGSMTYNAYTDTKYNEFILYNDKVYQLKTISIEGNSHPSAPELGPYFTRGDVCGKKIMSCKRRFWAISDNLGGAFGRNTLVPLPFGGFPGSKA